MSHAPNTTQSAGASGTQHATLDFANTSSSNAAGGAVTSAVASAATYTDAVALTTLGLTGMSVLTGRWLPSFAQTAPGAATATSGVVSFGHPICVRQTTTFTAFGFATAVVTGGSYKVGLYANNGTSLATPTGNPISNSTITMGPFTTAAATQQNSNFGTAVTLTPGWYWPAILADTTGTVSGSSTTVLGWVLGSDDLSTFAAKRPTFTQAYASGLPDMTSNAMTQNVAGTVLCGAIKVQ